MIYMWLTVSYRSTEILFYVGNCFTPEMFLGLDMTSKRIRSKFFNFTMTGLKRPCSAIVNNEIYIFGSSKIAKV